MSGVAPETGALVLSHAANAPPELQGAQRYVLGPLIGEGATGRVYRATRANFARISG